ncbi:MAG: hypothetical protein QXD03_02125 [Candidatus Anstonellales archaeon]
MRNFEKELVSIFYKNIECINFYEFYGDIVYSELKTLDMGNYIKEIATQKISIMKHIVNRGNITMVTLFGASTALKYIVKYANIDGEISNILNNYEKDFENLKSYINDDPVRYYLYGNFCNSVIINISRNRNYINNAKTPIHIFELFKEFCDITGIDDTIIEDGYHRDIVEAVNILVDRKLSFINISTISNGSDRFFKVSIKVNKYITDKNPLFPKRIYVTVFNNDIYSTRSMLIYGKKLIRDNFMNMLKSEVERIKLIM